MNILTRVTLKQLLKNRTRTVVTVIGIILSAAMITAVTSSLSTVVQFFQDYTVYEDGLWHVDVSDVPVSELSTITDDERVDSAVSAQILGYAAPEGLDEDDYTANVYMYLYVLGVDEGFFDRLGPEITRGRLPQSPDEIALCAYGNEFFKGGRPELGSQITLGLGDRCRSGDGLRLGKFDSLVTDDEGRRNEEVQVRETRTFTVVGYYENVKGACFANPGYTCYTLWDSDSTARYAESWVLLKDPREVFQFQEDCIWTSQDNTDYLMALGVSRFSAFYSVLSGMAAVLIGLIMFGSVSLIYNAFSISVAERTRQFGLLRSVGATRRQTRRMVLNEAMFVSLVGVPLGILSGILGMWITFRFIGDDLARLMGGYRDGVIVGPTLRLSVRWWSVALAAVIGFVTVLISAWVPSRRAVRITAIQAIRQSSDVTVSRREVRTSPLTYRLFGLEGAIAGKYFKRDRKRYRATVVSLFMSVVLFISASSFCRYLTDAVKGVFEDHDYDISYDYLSMFYEDAVPDEPTGLKEAADLLRAVPGVLEVTPLKSVSVNNLRVTRDMMDDRALELLDDPLNSVTAYPDYTDEEELLLANTFLYGIEDETYRNYLRSMGLDEEEYMGEHPKVILRSSVGFFLENGAYTTVKLLRDDVETVDLALFNDFALSEKYTDQELYAMSNEEYSAACDEATEHHTYEVGLVTDKLPMGLNGRDEQGIFILMPYSEAARIDVSSGRFEDIFFRTEDHEQVCKALRDAATEAGLPSGAAFTDIYAANTTQRSIVKVVRVLSYGFITLISLIAVANVFNTVSTNILLRRREFAMLRSVGMTDRGFNRMMNYECLLYGAKSLLYGLPAAFAVTYIIFRTVNTGFTIGFYLPWTAVAVAVGSVFLVVFATMMYSMSGIKRDNPIDAMRSELI